MDDGMDDYGLDFSITPRSYWTFGLPKWKAKTCGPCSFVFFLNSKTRSCETNSSCVRELNFIYRAHIHNQGCPDIRYNFLIGGDGNVYEGRGWNVRPSLPKRYYKLTDRSVVIGFIGPYEALPLNSPKSDKPFSFVSCSRWRREKPKNVQKMETPVPFVFLSYTRREPCFSVIDCMKELKWMQKCHTYYLNIGDLRFNFLIGGDGTVYEGRGWFAEPVIPGSYKKYNSVSIYIAFMGLFKDEPPLPKMLEAQEELIKYGVQQNYIKKNFNLFTLHNPKDSRLHFLQMQSKY